MGSAFEEKVQAGEDEDHQQGEDAEVSGWGKIEVMDHGVVWRARPSSNTQVASNSRSESGSSCFQIMGEMVFRRGVAERSRSSMQIQPWRRDGVQKNSGVTRTAVAGSLAIKVQVEGEAQHVQRHKDSAQ
jgi:hypothetical protein